MYKILFSKTAAKELAILSTQAVNRIIPAIKKLADNPRPAGSKKLKGQVRAWRIRIGDYRVVIPLMTLSKL